MPLVTVLSEPSEWKSRAAALRLECFHSCPQGSVMVVIIRRETAGFAPLLANPQSPGGGRHRRFSAIKGMSASP